MTAVDVNREVTPALVRGSRGAVAVLRAGELAPGLEGQLAHHVFDDGGGARVSTLVLTAVPEGVAFAPALVCRDRDALAATPAQLPGERWEPIELESTAFAHRYRLLALAGQDQLYARELFSPAFIAWLTEVVPAGFSFELNERFLVALLPGRLEGEELDRLCRLAAELARLVREEAGEEGEGSGLFDEAAKLREIEAALGKVRFETPPASVGVALERYRDAARWRPTVLARALFWGLVGFAVVALPAALIFDPLVALVAGAFPAYLGFWIGRLFAATDYRWGRAATVRRLGLEAFRREYAAAHGLHEEDRWRFHSRHRRLPLPGTVASVASGPLPGWEGEASFLTLGDAAELRSRGIEVAFSSERPLAAIAVVAEVGGAERARELGAGEPPAGLRVEADGATVAIWRPVAGNLAFSAREFDEFRAAAGVLLAGRNLRTEGSRGSAGAASSSP